MNSAPDAPPGTSAKSKRLFVGLPLPAELRHALCALDPKLPHLLWLADEQMHLTLSFLGEVPAIHHETLAEQLRTVRVEPFRLPLFGLGAFEAQGKPTVVWVSTGKGHPHLFVLHRWIQDAVIRAGLAPDLRPFRPHVTIARAKGISQEALKPFLKRHREWDGGVFEAGGFTLYASVLSSAGATHTPELTVTF